MVAQGFDMKFDMKKVSAIFAFLVLTISVPAHATAITGFVTGGTAFAAGGTFVKLTAPIANPFGPPNSVGNDTFQSPNLYEFDEDQNILLAALLNVDVGSNITLIGNGIFSATGTGTGTIAGLAGGVAATAAIGGALLLRLRNRGKHAE
jgi:hypothetical protein